MANIFFYAMTIMIWGSTWLAIKFQLGVIDPSVSVAYRFVLATVILFAWCLVRRLPLHFSLQNHMFIALQGVCLFAVNYLLFYLAEPFCHIIQLCKTGKISAPLRIGL